MASKAVIDRQKSAELLLQIQDAQGDLLTRGYEVLVTPDGRAAMEAAASASRAAVAASMVELVLADEAVERETREDSAARKRRDRTKVVARERAIGTRAALVGAYGADGEVVSGPTPEDPVVLARFLGELRTSMLMASLGEPRSGISVDVDTLAESLADARTALEADLTEMARDIRETQAAIAKRNTALTRHDARFRFHAAFLSAVFNAAGERDLASKVRPSTSNPGRLRNPDEVTDDDIDGAAPGSDVVDGAAFASEPSPDVPGNGSGG